ncbi:ycii-related domain protein [Phlyctema vagabunda]|uniref:Ycii-related domain protein n=1 Tax=Phlyctema vagabunda TaxID=108571 RepID=A0ABR4P1U4_9HELO
MAQRYEFLFIAYDYPGVAEAKLELVPSHEDMIKEEKAKNSSVEWLAGGSFSPSPSHPSKLNQVYQGPFFKEHGTVPPEMIGSWGILYAPTRQDAVERLKRDMFTEGKIWDWEKMVIVDSVSGMRLSLPNPGTEEMGRGLQ